jgi:hypothetical protein
MTACVTISNVVNSQHVMYSGKQHLVQNVSYTNLLTTGSMALPPDYATILTFVSATSTAAPASTSNGTFMPTTAPDVPPGSASLPIVVGVISGVVISGCVSFCIYVKFCKEPHTRRNRVRAVVDELARLPRHGIADASRQVNHSLDTMPPHGRANISTTNVMNPDDYLSPIASNRMARNAKARAMAREELQSIQDRAELEVTESQLEGAHPEPAFYSTKPANPSSRWSASNIPVSFQQSQMNRERRYNSLNDMIIATDRPAFENPYDSVDSLIIAPNPRIGLDSPLAGGVSTLMRGGDRASVGECPARRGSITHCAPTKIRHSWARARCDSPLFGEPGTASSYTRGLPFLTPEQEHEREKIIKAAAAGTAKKRPAKAVTTPAEEIAIAELSNTEAVHAEAAQDETISHSEPAAADETDHTDSAHAETGSHKQTEISDSVHTDSATHGDSAAH